MKLYAYCLTSLDAKKPHDLTGLFDQKVYAITSGNIAVFVSDVVEDSVVANKQNALMHQQVVATVLEQTTPLPFRFGTVVSETQLMSYVEARQEALLQKLGALDGCVEMSAKVIWDKIETRGPGDPENRPSRGSGTAFLRAKAEELIGNKRLLEEANSLKVWLKNQVGSFVRDSRITVSPAQRLVIAADYLVERSQLDSYRNALQLARNERPELHFLTSGPWPPYSFANIDLEFKSHLGVS